MSAPMNAPMSAPMSESAGHPAAGQRRIAWLFLRLLGLTYLAAFLSLGVQVIGLIGRDGLLPLGEFLDAARRSLGPARFAALPTVFWAASSDLALRAGIAAGVLGALALALDLAPRLMAVLLWALYLSFATAGRDFLSFQWDNLLLESGFLAIFLAPGHLLPCRPAAARARAAEPPRLLLFLFRWLLFRLLFESGLAKLLTGDPAWRDLSAMQSYFETAPLPTWIGWHAHQLPPAALQALALLTLAVELAGPFAVLGPRRVRAAFLPVHVAFQLAILLTANYGFFNYLALALGLFLLDDGHLGRPAAPLAGARRSGLGRALLAAALAAVIVPLSALEFASMWMPDERLPRVLRPLARVREAAAPFRSVNRYHLFATMTLRRLEVEIQGTADGENWEAYEFRVKPGDPRRAPPFVAPHQPRLDFQLWFLTLGGGGTPPYFVNLLRRLCAAPERMAGFFARDPFAHAPPAAIRVAGYRYRMASREERRQGGVWWTREALGFIGSMRCGEARRGGRAAETSLKASPRPADHPTGASS